MSGPFIFSYRGKLVPDKREEYLAHCREAAEIVESEEPRVIAFHIWESADGSETSCVQVHPDVESLEFHFKIFMEKLAGRAESAVQVLEYDIYGEPSKAVMDVLRWAPDADVHVFSRHVSGFLRPQPL